MVGDDMKVYDIGSGFKEADDDWQPGSNYYWIISEAGNISEILKKIPLDDECVEECKNLKQSAKISFFKDYVFIVFNILEYGPIGIFSRELNLFLGKDYIITVYKGKSDILEELLDDIQNNRNCFILNAIHRPCILLYYILDRIIIRNYNVISDLEAKADQVELSILKAPKRKQASELIDLRRQVYRARKFLNPLMYIGDSIIINDNGIIEEQYIKYFTIINKKIDKLMLVLENLVQDIALAREAFESETANVTNELMKLFSIVAAIFLPLELIANLFGMNFDYMPLKSHVYGYYMVLALMIVSVIYLAYLFKKNKWL